MLVELQSVDGFGIFVRPEHVLAVHDIGGTCEVVLSWMNKSQCYRVVGTAAEIAAKLNAVEASNG